MNLKEVLKTLIAKFDEQKIDDEWLSQYTNKNINV